MKTSTKIIAVTLTVASLAAVSIVSAHPGGGYGMGYGQGMGPGVGMMGFGHGMMGGGAGYGMGIGSGMGFDSPAVLAARLADLKGELKITSAQEPAWQQFELQWRQQVETGQAFRAAMWAQMQDPKASIDHNAQHETMTKLFAAQEAARTALYAVLSPEQKSLADQQLRGGYGRHMWSQAPTR